jgi:lipopolysaccharide transport system ATP-binding protein
MAQTGIHFEHVWKRFRRGDQVNVLSELIPRLLRRAVVGPDDLRKREFWAVRDVSFEVRPGEALGIIGPNGAGKSTVLKLLTRILRPNRGYCELRGRVGSLIEISAGFHQDLTGRENVFFQGAIMGMKRREIRDRFDDIVEFSGVSEFIDTPVRHYSSGMNARLGFSIAAHLNPEVLIIDEVLSIGDYAFQQRAFDRIREMVSRNAAAVVVSHQLDRISTLCQRAILLKQGRVAFDGETADTISAYVSDAGDSMGGKHDAPITIDRLRLIEGKVVKPGGRIVLRVTCRIVDREKVKDTSGVSVRLRSLQSAQVVFATATALQGIDLSLQDRCELEVTLEMNVEAGLYAIETGVYDITRGTPLANGPRVSVKVEPDFSFAGRTYARPSMKLVSFEEPEEAISSSSTVAGSRL